MSAGPKQIKNDKRRRQILTATLKLLRRDGAGVTTAQIAAQAHCSKETLYNWFGSREGLMLALVDAQAEFMGQTLQKAFQEAEGSLELQLKQQATLLLDLMTGEALIAVNRIAMAEACSRNSKLGQAVLADWQQQVEKPFVELFQKGNQKGELIIHSSKDAFESLIGLLIGDRQRRLLLGENMRPDASAMRSLAAKAVQRWLILYKA